MLDIRNMMAAMVYLFVASIAAKAVEQPNKEDIERRRAAATHVVQVRLQLVYEAETKTEEFETRHFIVEMQIDKVEKGRGLMPGGRLLFRDQNERFVGQGPVPGMPGQIDWKQRPAGMAIRLFARRGDDGLFVFVDEDVLHWPPDAEKAKAALIELIRGNRELFAGNPDPDRLQSVDLVPRDDRTYALGAFVIDVSKRVYSADIGDPSFETWFYYGRFRVRPDGSWVADKPEAKQALAAPAK